MSQLSQEHYDGIQPVWREKQQQQTANDLEDPIKTFEGNTHIEDTVKPGEFFKP